MAKILCIDDDINLLQTIKDYLVPRRETWKSAFLTLLPDAS